MDVSVAVLAPQGGWYCAFSEWCSIEAKGPDLLHVEAYFVMLR